MHKNENDSFYWLTRLIVYIASLTDVFDRHIHTHRVTTDFSVFCQLTHYLIVIKYWPHLIFCIHETS